MLDEGLDPMGERKKAKLVSRLATETTFEGVGREWFEREKGTWVTSHADRVFRRLEKDVFPWLGTRPIPRCLAAGDPLRLAPLVFLRPGELRKAQWSEFDLDAALWEVPGERMKRLKAEKALSGGHLVPLSKQALAILRDLHWATTATRCQVMVSGQRLARWSSRG